VIDRFGQFPKALADRARAARLSGVPAMLAHPDWERPAPVVLWMHGRTATKELDPGRYLRWIRAGIAACAIDLPGHGERADLSMQTPARTLEVLAQAVQEIDGVVTALAGGEHGGLFDTGRMGIGGMSAGGMAALRRLCEPHIFRCAAVEGTTGDLAGLYHPGPGRQWPVAHPREKVAAADPMQHLDGWRPIPLLALHSVADRLIPFALQRGFVEALRDRYRQAGADPGLVELVSWPQTGAPEEHLGFGRHSNEAKNIQTDFLTRSLGPRAGG
jgi:dienelactone hydrolase